MSGGASQRARGGYWLDFPLTYRAEEVAYIARWIDAGEGGVIVGGSGTGKSNLVGFMASRPELFAPMAAGGRPLRLLHFDTNSLPFLTVPYFYRGLFHALVLHTRQQDIGAARSLQELASTPGDWNDAFFAYSMLLQAHELLIRDDGRRIVWLIDRFDDACTQLDAQALNSLRSLRDRFKGNLTYCVATRHRLGRLRDLGEIDEFYEMVAANICWVGPMVERDARWIAAQMEARLHASFLPAAVARLMAVTGRLPAFMKAGSIALADGVLRIEDDAAVWTDALLARPEFQRNCREIWQDLSPSEQQALLHLHQGTPVVGDAVQDLQAMGFVRATDAGATIFSPIFAAFLARMPATSTAVPPPAQAAALSPLVADSASGVVLRNGHPLDVTLTNHEHHLLRYFLSHPGEVCTKDDLMAAVWPDDVLIDGVRDDRLAQLIKRLRAKIEPTPAKPTYIQTVRGRGYRLSI